MLFLRHVALMLFTIAVSAPSQADINKCNAFDAIDVDINRDGQMDLATVDMVWDIASAKDIKNLVSLKLYLSQSAIENCQADYSIGLYNLYESEELDNYVLSVNNRGSLVVNPLVYAGSLHSGFPHVIYNITLRLDDQLKVIGYDYRPRNFNSRALGYSINLLSGEAILITYASIRSGGGQFEEQLVDHSLSPFIIHDGSMISFPPEFQIWEREQHDAWYEKKAEYY